MLFRSVVAHLLQRADDRFQRALHVALDQEVELLLPGGVLQVGIRPVLAVADAGDGAAGKDERVWQPIPDLPTPQPSSFYSTRIKARREWIDSVLATRTAITPTILGAATVTGPYVADTAPSIDASTKTITIAIGSANRFFQLQSTTALTIVNTRLVGSNLVIQYQ